MIAKNQRGLNSCTSIETDVNRALYRCQWFSAETLTKRIKGFSLSGGRDAERTVGMKTFTGCGWRKTIDDQTVVVYCAGVLIRVTGAGSGVR